MRDLPLPTFSIAELDAAWRLGTRLSAAWRALQLRWRGPREVLQ